jgi:hypothetical protein
MFPKLGAGIVHSVLQLAMKGLEFSVPVGSTFSILHIVQTGSGGFPASYPMGTEVLCIRRKRAGQDDDHWRQGQEIVNLYICST